jgi:8-oxo-dGTP pyrophosphatase MutT (NUDIX family)
MFGGMSSPLRRSVRKLARADVRAAHKGLVMARAAGAKVFRQSAVVPYRRRRGRLEVLLITSRGSGDWIVPKGLVEPDMTEHDSAAKEAQEEAGVLGRVGATPVGSFEYEKWGGVCVVRVFDLEVRDELSDWPEKAQRTRQWFEADEAARLVKHARLGEIIARLPSRV